MATERGRSPAASQPATPAAAAPLRCLRTGARLHCVRTHALLLPAPVLAWRARFARSTQVPLPVRCAPLRANPEPRLDSPHRTAGRPPLPQSVRACGFRAGLVDIARGVPRVGLRSVARPGVPFSQAARGGVAAAGAAAGFARFATGLARAGRSGAASGHGRATALRGPALRLPGWAVGRRTMSGDAPAKVGPANAHITVPPPPPPPPGCAHAPYPRHTGSSRGV